MNQRLVDELVAGRAVTFVAHGGSMTPRLASGTRVTVEPWPAPNALERDDVVFCKVRGRLMLHKVYAVRGDEVQIGNNHGHVNGWTPRRMVYGRLAS